MDEATRRDTRLRNYQAETTEALERLKFTVALVQSGIQGLTLINGGALVALFALVGAVSDRSAVKLDPSMLWLAFAAFAGGLALTMLANLGAFLSQNAFYVVATWQAWNYQDLIEGKTPSRDVAATHRRGEQAQYAGTAAAVFALVAFVIGCGFALRGVMPS